MITSKNADVETPYITDGMAFVVAENASAKESEWDKNGSQYKLSSCEVRAALMGTYTAATVMFNSGRRATSANPDSKSIGCGIMLPDRNLVVRRRVTSPAPASPCQMERDPTGNANYSKGEAHVDVQELPHRVSDSNRPCPVSKNHMIVGMGVQVSASNMRMASCKIDSDWQVRLILSDGATSLPCVRTISCFWGKAVSLYLSCSTCLTLPQILSHS